MRKYELTYPHLLHAVQHHLGRHISNHVHLESEPRIVRLLNVLQHLCLGGHQYASVLVRATMIRLFECRRFRA